MPLSVTSEILDVSEIQTVNTTDELAWNGGLVFSPTNVALTAIVAGIAGADPTSTFTTPQIAVESNLFTLTPPPSGGIKDLKLTSDANGTPYSSTVGIDSGLTTNDGTHIYLFKGDADSNVVKGLIGSDPAGKAAFVIVLDETTSGGNVTAAKLWVIEFAPIHHTGANATDSDYQNLLNKVFVSTTEQVSNVFSDFSDVPSGSPIFAMIADDSNTQGANAIDFLVTAFQVDDPTTQTNEAKAAITVNVSSQGSFPGSLASGSQNITPGTGMRFDLVKGGTTSYNKQAGQSGSGIAYSDNDATTTNDHAEVSSAGFSIVQNQGGRGTDLRLDAYKVGATEQHAQGTTFISNLADQQHVQIASIRVYVINPATGQPAIDPGTGQPQILFDNTPGANTPNTAQVDMNADGSVTVHGMKLNWTVVINGDANGFDRFTATNVSTDQNAYVDIGRLTVSVLKDSADNDEVGSHIRLHDSGPTMAVSATAIATWLTDESALASGNAAEKTASDSTTDTHNVTANFTATFGPDGPLGGSAVSGIAYRMTISAPNVDTLLIDTATGDHILLRLTAGGLVEGYLANHTSTVAFTVGVSNAAATSGDVTLTQLRSIKEGNAASHNETIGMATANLIGVQAVATDAEGLVTGDSASASINIADRLSFRDDGPGISPTGSAPTLLVDESGLASGSLANQPALATASASVAANFTSVAGADGLFGGSAATAISYALSANEGDLTGLTDTATNSAVTIHVVDSTHIQGLATTGGGVVFTVAVNAGTGQVTLTQLRAVVHATHPDPDDSQTLAANLISVTATIKDGDADVQTATKSISDGMTFKDDGPSVSASGSFGNLIVDESALPTGNPEVGASASATSAAITSLFTSAGGADGSAGPAYKLEAMADGTLTGLKDTATGQDVVLKTISASQVQGVLAGDGATTVFTVTLNANNTITLTQSRAIVHATNPNPDDASPALSANLIKLTATITDGDSDPASASQSISNHLIFEDDGPKLTVGSVTPDTLSVDDDALNSPVSATFASVFIKAFGADAAAASNSTVYSLSAVAGGSGVYDTGTDQQVQLKLDAGVVHGYVTISGVQTDVFTVGVNSGTGQVTLTQQRAIRHVDTGTLTDASQDPTNLVGTNLIGLVATITDKDGDSASATADLTQTLEFKDSQPTITTPAGLDLKFAPGSSHTNSFTTVFGADGAEAGTTVEIASFNSVTNSVYRAVASNPVGGTHVDFYDTKGTANTADDTLSFHMDVTNTGYTVTVDALPTPDEVPLDFASIASGGPKEVLSVPLVGGGDSIVFDGFINGAQDPGDNDYLNPDNVGFGVKGGQASQINPGESFSFTTASGSGLSSLSFDIAGIGGLSQVTVQWRLYDDNGTPGNTADDILVDSGSMVQTLPKGNNVIRQHIIDDGAATSLTGFTPGAGHTQGGESFDYGIVSFAFPGTSSNQGIRVLDFAAGVPGAIPPAEFNFTLMAEDGDGDQAFSDLITVRLDPTFA